MKTNNYLWAVLATATLSLTACGSDENENVTLPKEKTAKLELTLVGTPAASRTTGTLPTTDESQINRLTVAVFTGTSGNPVNALHEFTGDDIKDAAGGTGKKVTMLCEPGNGQTIYVVANASSALLREWLTLPNSNPGWHFSRKPPSLREPAMRRMCKRPTTCRCWEAPPERISPPEEN